MLQVATGAVGISNNRSRIDGSSGNSSRVSTGSGSSSGGRRN